MSSPPPPPAACSQPEMLAGVLRESRRVVAAHTRHFLALSVLFLLPLSSLLSFSPSLLPSPHRRPLLRFSVLPTPLPIAAAIALLSAALLLTASAAAAITGSVHRSFFGRPVRLLPALASLSSALPRLLLTLLAVLLPLALLLLLLLSSPLLLLRLPLDLALAALSAVSVLYFQINFSLAFSIAVLESNSGFGPLRRSVHLVRGMRCAALCLNLFFSVVTGAVLWGFSLSWVSVTGGWREVLPVVAKTVFCSAVTAVLLLYWLVTNAVMYLYCKALHGELEREIVEEFAWEYVCLPFDDQKVPHVVSVVQQRGRDHAEQLSF